MLLVLGSLAVVIGIYSVEAAEISSARGGGLLSPYAYLPLLFGVPVLVLAVCSLVVALVGLHPYRPEGVLPEDASPPVLTWGGKNALVVLSLLLTPSRLHDGYRASIPVADCSAPRDRGTSGNHAC